MIRFKEVTPADRALIQSYTLWGERQNCDLSFANIISWRFLYNTEYAIVDDFLVFRFYAGRHLAYMMPIPKPRPDEEGRLCVQPSGECSREVIRAVRDDAIAMGHPFLMMGVCNFMVDLLEDCFPDTFDIHPDRNYSDYVYTREKLINLSGKKLQSKRNHINKFKSLYPDYEYRNLTPEIIPECLALERQWRTAAMAADGISESSSLSEELRSMTRAFNHWDELQLTGGAIYVDGRLVAFTFGCPINQSTFDVCVEKADVSYEGSFTIINQEFVKHLPEQYFYINREEDLGDEGLRRAKESYKPDILLEKNVVMEKRPLASFEDQDRILAETRALWQEVFHDPEPFVELYFSRVYRSEYNISCQLDGHVAGALQTLPYPMRYRGIETQSAYVSGVSVNPGQRCEGIGSSMMRQAHFAMSGRETVFATLIPAEEWLYGWYERLGYARVITSTPAPVDARTTSYDDFAAMERSFPTVVLHTADAWDIVREDIRLAGASYAPQSRNIPAMLRVINAEKAIALYAQANPEASLTIEVTADRDIPANNAFYVVSGGQVKKTTEPSAEARQMDIKALAEFLFEGQDARMWLMLN